MHHARFTTILHILDHLEFLEQCTELSMQLLS